MKRNELSEEVVSLLDEQVENEKQICPNNVTNENTVNKPGKKYCKCTIFKTKMDGGYSWIITISAFFIHFCLFGFMNNVSLLNIHWMKDFGVEAGNVAWVGSINVGVMFLFGPFAALLDKKLGCQATGIIGCVLSTLGVLLASFSSSFILLLLSYGFIFGFGASCCFFSSIIIQAKYFDRRLALSNGIVTAGAGAGTLLISAFAPSVYDKLGWRTGIRYYSFVFLCLIVLKMFYNDLVVRMNICRPGKRNTRREKIQLSPFIWIRSFATDLCPLYLLKNIPFLIFNIACIFFMLGYYIPYIHLVLYAQNVGVNQDSASFLIGYMAISSLIGKLVTGKIAEIPSVSPIALMIISFVFIGFSHIGVTLAKTFPHFIAYSLIFGFFDGSYNCLVTVAVNDLIGRNQLGSGIGLLFAVKSFPLMCGGPLAGFLFDYFRSYVISFLVGGVFIIIAVYLMMLIPIYKLYHHTASPKYTVLSFDTISDQKVKKHNVSCHNGFETSPQQMLNTHPSFPTPKANSCGEYALVMNEFNTQEKTATLLSGDDIIQRISSNSVSLEDETE